MATDCALQLSQPSAAGLYLTVDPLHVMTFSILKRKLNTSLHLNVRLKIFCDWWRVINE